MSLLVESVVLKVLADLLMMGLEVVKSVEALPKLDMAVQQPGNYQAHICSSKRLMTVESEVLVVAEVVCIVIVTYRISFVCCTDES